MLEKGKDFPTRRQTMNLTTWHLPLLIVLSLWGLGLAVVTRGEDHKVQRWKHKAGPIDGRFVREGDKLYLYSLDL